MSVSMERRGNVFLVTLFRPHAKNAVDRDTAEALADAFRVFEADESAHVAVLWGRGGTFCAGADLKAISAGRPNRLEPSGDAPMGPTRMLLSKPVIAAIAGYAVAGGLELAVWCDLRVMEETAVMGCLERRWGVPLIDGGTFRLPRLIGHSRAMDLLLTGRPVDAQEALHIGLANRVVPEGQALDAAVALAEEIASFPQVSMRNDLLSAYQQWSLSPEDALQHEFALGQAALATETVLGATQFAKGAGRHGSFKKEDE